MLKNDSSHFAEILDEASLNLKKEAASGLVQIISKLFQSLIEPVLKLIDKIRDRLIKRIKKRNIEKDMDVTISDILLKEYLKRNDFELIVWRTKNGEHDETGFGYRYIHPFFTYCNSTNELLELFY